MKKLYYNKHYASSSLLELPSQALSNVAYKLEQSYIQLIYV